MKVFSIAFALALLFGLGAPHAKAVPPFPFPVPASGPINNGLPGLGVAFPNGTIVTGGFQSFPGGGAAAGAGVVLPNGTHVQAGGFSTPGVSGGGASIAIPLPIRK